MHLVKFPEITPEKFRYQPSVDRRIETRKMKILYTFATSDKEIRDFSDLGGLPGPIKTFQYYKHNFLTFAINYKNKQIIPIVKDKGMQNDTLSENHNEMTAYINPERDIKVMGIINITDDSYFSASRAKDSGSIAARCRRLIEEGADIIDIGACSTRPGSEYVDPDTEWKNIRLALETLEREGIIGKTEISIDTFRAEIAEKAYDMIGNFTVNDISAGEDDKYMLETAGRLGLPYIAMHKRGTPKDMQSRCDYEDVTGEIISYFKDFGEKASKAGIKDYIIDPGFGFAKTVEQNYTLLENLDKFSCLGKGILIGISRKSMITKLLNIPTEEALPATSALHLHALFKGADILRVHDVKEAVQCVRLYRTLCKVH